MQKYFPDFEDDDAGFVLFNTDEVAEKLDIDDIEQSNLIQSIENQKERLGKQDGIVINVSKVKMEEDKARLFSEEDL